MATLAVSRDAAYMDSLRAYWVVVDGNRVGKIKNGQSFSFSLPPGEHTIMMKIDWCGSSTINFTVREGETVYFRTVTRLRGVRMLLAPWYVIFDRFGYIVLERV